MGVTDSVKIPTIQNLPPNRIIGFLEVCEKQMYCCTVFLIFLLLLLLLFNTYVLLQTMGPGYSNELIEDYIRRGK
jgi:hypothetical protein